MDSLKNCLVLPPALRAKQHATGMSLLKEGGLTTSLSVQPATSLKERGLTKVPLFEGDVSTADRGESSKLRDLPLYKLGENASPLHQLVEAAHLCNAPVVQHDYAVATPYR